MTQEQRMYQMIETEGVDVAIEWFKKHGTKAKWGGSNMALADQLIKEGQIENALRFIELDIELTPGKVWMLRKASQVCLDNGRPQKAIFFLKKALKLRPDYEGFQMMIREAEQDLKNEAQRSQK